MHIKVQKHINIFISLILIINLIILNPNRAAIAADTTLLDKPVNVNAYFVSSANKVYVTWEGSWTGKVYIDIEKKIANGYYSSIYTITDPTIKDWVDVDVDANKTYTYMVRARIPDSTNVSAYSDEVTVTCLVRNTPGSLTAYAVSSGEIQLNWSDVEYNNLGYVIWRRTNEQDSWEKYAELPSEVYSFSDRKVNPNTKYYYKLMTYIQYDNNNYSHYSNETWAKTWLPGSTIEIDYSITASGKVSLEWSLDHNVQEAISLSVERLSEEDSEWNVLSIMSTGSTHFIDYNANSYEKYLYRLKILSLDNNSIKYSNVISVIPGVPAAPTDLELETLSPNSMRLKWKDNSINEDGFVIERMIPQYRDYIRIDTIEGNLTNYVEIDLIPGKLYYYRIKAVNKSGSSGYSNEVYTLPNSPKTFTDLDRHSWAREAIEYLSNRGVINGKTDNLFFPDDQITRAEFVSLVVRSFNLSRTPVGKLNDVIPSDWYYKDIMAAKSIGIITADDGYFNPDTPITREDMAVIIYKTLNTINKPLLPYDTGILDGYLDKDQVSPYALPYMASLKGEKIIDGRSSTILAPKDTATRAEAAVILFKIIDRPFIQNTY